MAVDAPQSARRPAAASSRTQASTNSRSGAACASVTTRLSHAAAVTADSAAVGLSQRFATRASELWSACTDPERLARWFEPVEGELRAGGRYRLTESGTVGTIEACDEDRRLSVTWEYDDDVSHVTVTLVDVEAGWAELTVRHTSAITEHWRAYGPSAGGIGWDTALLGLAMHLENARGELDDVQQAMDSEDGLAFTRRLAEAWSAAHQQAGASLADADAAAQRALDFDAEMRTGE